MMGSTLLSKVNRRIAALKRAPHRMTHIQARKKAWAEYRGGKIAGTGVKKKKSSRPVRKKRRIGAVTKKAATRARKKKVVDPWKPQKKVVTVTSIGSVSSHVSAAKKGLEQMIGIQSAKVYIAKTKKAKRKLQKKLTEYKARFRKLAC